MQPDHEVSRCEENLLSFGVRVRGSPEGETICPEAGFVDSKRLLEVALTVLAAILLLVGAEGRYPYGFYMLLRTAVTVCAAYWVVRV